MIVRESARAVLVNRDGRMLLFQFSFPNVDDPCSPDGGPLWVTPGGAIEPGENDEAALRRELAEETGIEGFTLGPPVWVREVMLVERGQPLLSRERNYLVQLPDNPLINRAGFSQVERDTYHGHRWFSADDLCSEPRSFRPPGMGLYLRDILAGRVPAEPLKIE